MELFYIFLLVLIDQFTKLIAKLNLYPDGNINIISGYLSLTYLENRGQPLEYLKTKSFFSRCNFSCYCFYALLSFKA